VEFISIQLQRKGRSPERHRHDHSTSPLPPLLLGRSRQTPCWLLPRSQRPQEATEKITALLNAGIRHFINLMEPDERDRTGQLFVPYEDLLESIASKKGIPVTFDRLSIKDLSVPTEKYMARILNQIDLFIKQGRPVYVHCLGGIGRTGTVVGCYLVRHGLATGKNVLEMIRELRKDCEDADRRSPETGGHRNRGRWWWGGVIVEDHLKFTRDSEFSSPSAAATVVHGGSANGLHAWKSKDGKTLKELEAV
jgi:hypothetical protein